MAAILAQLFTLSENAVDEDPSVRNLIASGIASYSNSQFVLEGKVIQSAAFAASFKRCGLLWNLMLKELDALSCPQRLLLKLQYCQRFCIQTFNSSPLDTKRSMASDNAASVTFAVELSVAVIQGFLPTEPNQMAATMISFFQQFQQYIPCDIAPLHPSHYQNVLAKLIVISEPNKYQEAALELVMTTILHSVSYYGWRATIGDVDIETLVMVAVHSQSEKLSITSKALLAFMPGTLGVEVLLDKEQLCLIVRQLSIVSTTFESRSKEYSVRDILTITKAVTKVSDNCRGLLEQGLEETLDTLMEQGDETANAVAAELTWRIAAASGATDVEEELMERCSTERTLDSKWGYASPQTKDPDGTIVFADILLHHLAELVFKKKFPGDLSAEQVLTMDTLLFTVFDMYWQSEIKMRDAISELFGEKYIRCLIDLDHILHNSFALKVKTVAHMKYGMLIQEMARKSEYFCEKSGAGGLIGILLCTVQNYMNTLVARVDQTMLEYRLVVLFYCAHIKMFHYSGFGMMSALDTLPCVLESSAAHTRLLTRLVICCLHPIMEDRHMTHLKMTEEESQLLLTYVKDTQIPGGLDRAKFLMAVSVLYREFCPQNALGPVAGIIAETVVKQILQDCDNRVLEGALCLLWTLCRTSGIAQNISQISHFVPVLKQMQQTSIPAISLLAKSVLWQLGYGNYKDDAECYDYARTCLHYGFYTECIDHCDHIIAAATTSVHGMARQVRGKAYAHLHQNQFWHIMKHGMLDVAVPWKRGNFVDQCATKAKVAVQDLGFALDHGVLDEEGSYLMDVAMLHYVRIKNQLRDCNRCLLCRRRGMKLKESHIWPRFLLKEVSKANEKVMQQLGIVLSADMTPFHSGNGRFAAYTPKTMTCAMLCARCEQCLSQNGEDQFRKDILPLIYSESDEIQTVKYTSAIYSFCLGIVFRSFVHFVFTAYCNASEIHSLFVACRHHLLSLSVKYSEVEDVANPPCLAEVTSMTPTEAFLFASPLKLHSDDSKFLLLSALMSSACGALCVTTPLSTEPESEVYSCHALVARLARCSIVVPFSPAQGGSLDTNFHINPSGGNYQILPDTRRWKTIPSGLLQTFVTCAVICEKQYQQVLSGMKTTKKDSMKADAFIDFLQKMVGLSELSNTASSLQSIPPKEEELITKFLSKRSLQVKILPEGFDLRDFRAPPPQVILKDGYMLLYHIHDEQQGATFFFAANPEGFPLGKLIVIIKFTEENESFERVEGFNVQIREDGSSCSICVTGNLLVPATEKLQETQHLRHRTVSERIKKAVNILLRKCGSPKVFLHHARLQMRLKDNPCLDHRCSSTGCWYCEDRCHICMDLANREYTTLHSKGLKFMHCSKECKAVVDEIPCFSVEVHPAVSHKPRCKKSVVLASIKGCLASVMSTHTVVQLSVCISTERTSITYGRPLAIVQLRTQEQHTFFSVYLSDDFSLIEPVNSFPQAFSFQMLKDSDILTQIFQMSLTPLEVFSIGQLLRGASGVDPTLAKAFCLSCSPCTSNFPLEDILVSFESSISQEEAFSKWIVEQVILACDDDMNLLQLQSSDSEDLSQELIPLLPSANACSTMFWTYLQLTCLLWKIALSECSLLVELKLTYTTLVTVKLYEQSPSDIQSCIISKFCSSAHILLLCGKISIAAIKGGLPLSLHQSAVQFLLLAHKFVATVSNENATMESIFVRHLCQELEGVKQYDVQKTFKVSAVAQQWLLTLMLKSLSYNAISIEANPILLNSIQTFLKSSFLGVAVIAKAIAVILLQHSPQAGLSVSDIRMTDKEVNFLAVILHDISQDNLKRRYYLYCILQVLNLLCSQPINASNFASHRILMELETLMKSAEELEDIIVNVLWKIATGGGEKKITEVTDKTLSGEISDSEVDISLGVEQGVCYTVNKLLMIIHEFCNTYLESKHIPDSHACTVSSVARLLYDLHRVMERREMEEVAESVSQHTAILVVLGLAISKHRELWPHIHNGVYARRAIELLLITWTDCSKVFCQAVVRVGVLTAIANSLHRALDCAALTANDIKGLQYQVMIICNVAQEYPKQTAFQIPLSALQPLLHCSSLLVRVLSKSILAFIAYYRDVSDITNFSLENDEAKFFADGLASFIQSGSASVNGVNFSGEELLYSLKCLTSLPSDKTSFAVPDMLDTVFALCLHDDKTIAKQALEVLWNISMEPTVALAILCHENVIDTLKKMSVFTCGLANFTRSILWILGYGNVTDTTDCSQYAIACYQLRKYTEAITWCDHVINMVGETHHVLSAVKSYKGKALAQIYLHKQHQQLQRSDKWAMLGYGNNSVLTEQATLKNLNLHSSASSNKILSKLCLADLENWKHQCSQGRQAIQLLGELLDSSELDEEGSELLDWVMMDYCRETGETHDCNRCLLCRRTGELVYLVLKPVPESENPTSDCNILSLHSFMYIEGSKSIFMFCKECEVLLSHYNGQTLEFIHKAITQEQPTTYGREVYLNLIARVVRTLSMAYNGYFSNQRDVYNTFLACRQILLSHEMYASTITFPKIHLFKNPKAWYIFDRQSFELNQFSKSGNAVIVSKHTSSKGGDPQEIRFLVMHTGEWNIVVDFGSEKAENYPLLSQYLICPAGGSYPIPSVKEEWETFPPELLQAFNDLKLADERRCVFRYIIKSEGKDLSAQPNPHWFSKSARFWLPQKHFISFLPEGFSMEVDSDAIRNISLPDGHKILRHHHNRDNDLTVFLAYATKSICQEKQFYFIFTCRLCNFFIADAIFLNGDAKGPFLFPNAMLFSLSSSLAIAEVNMVRQHLREKYCPIILSCVTESLMNIVITKFGDIGLNFKGVVTYEDITRNCNLAVSVDTRCSPEGCWYCQYRCHSCLKPAAIGYTWRDKDRKVFYHCSERCYYTYTADILNPTILDVKIGEIQTQPENGSHLLISATVVLPAGHGISKNALISTQISVSYGCTEIPSGVVYVHLQVCQTGYRSSLLVFFVQHDLSAAKCVWDVTELHTADITKFWREKAFIKKGLQPVFEILGCDDLPSFLEKNFPLLDLSFMSTNGTIYSWPPISGQGSQIETSEDGPMGQRGDGDPTPMN